MKKTTVMLLLVSFFMFYGNIANATSQVPGTPTLDPDANYTPQANDHRETNNTSKMCQSFVTSKSVIANYLDVSVAGTSTTGVIMSILVDSNNSPFAFGSLEHFNAPATFEQGNTTMTRFTTSGFTQVTPGQRYWLCLSSPVGNVVWWYSDNAAICGPCKAGTYPNGNIWYNNGIIYEQDFGFKIYSSNMEDPVITPDPTPDPTTPDPTPAVTDPTPTTTPVANNTPAASTPLPAGVTAGSGAAPAATSTSIKQPTDLVAADVAADQGGSIKLDWKASATTDIDGYKVFRSTEEKKGFTEVAKTEKTILTYTDNTASIGQKYYYMVRAYKTTKESVSTSTLSATSADNLAPAAPANFVFEASADKVTFIWDKNTEADLAGYTLSIINKADNIVVKSIDVASDLSIYELTLKDVPEMTADGKYDYVLTAKDAHGNISEKAVATAEKIIATEAKTTSSADTEKEGTPWVWYIIGAIVLGLAGFATYWFKFRKKKPVLNIN